MKTGRVPRPENEGVLILKGGAEGGGGEKCIYYSSRETLALVLLFPHLLLTPSIPPSGTSRSRSQPWFSHSLERLVALGVLFRCE